VIEVAIWREPDLSGRFDVDERGLVVLPLLGTRSVTSVAPEELRDSLLRDYRQYLQNPSIQITLLRRINVLGEVRNPGLYSVDATVSLADALAMAGGLSPNGNVNDIRLVRAGAVIQQDLDQTVQMSSLQVRSGDQIVVGERSWFSRNTGALLGAFVAGTAVIAAAIITSGN
jgi:polysaccharide export outer membrane protein